jgi:hypothetical protein
MDHDHLGRHTPDGPVNQRDHRGSRFKGTCVEVAEGGGPLPCFRSVSGLFPIDPGEGPCRWGKCRLALLPFPGLLAGRLPSSPYVERCCAPLARACAVEGRPAPSRKFSTTRRPCSSGEAGCPPASSSSRSVRTTTIWRRSWSCWPTVIPRSPGRSSLPPWNA